MTTAPGLIIDPSTIPARPAATISTSARRACPARSRVFELHIVTVAPAASSNIAIGFPTILLAPTITASAPRSDTPSDSRSFITP
ncbi:Uncharacterised protein [Bordetella pertussis]|nr:Uncharacterised protein [Bordetella pertussis]